MRTILHCDCNSFFASVELRDRPDLLGLPVAVCGDPQKRHGIILAKTEAAKKYGVQTAETIWQARKKCPGLVLLPADSRKYVEASKAVYTLCQSFTNRIEPFGLDENWLDVTGDSGETVAAELRRRCRKELGITMSVGVSFNKVFAKLGSDMRKPDATTVISKGNYQSKVWPLPVQDLLFIGRKSRARLTAIGIYTIGDLAVSDPDVLKSVFGKNGLGMRAYARGEDDSPVRIDGEHHPIKSVGNSSTPPHDIESEEAARALILELSDSVAARLRRCQKACRTVSLWLRDTSLHGTERQCRLPFASNLSEEIAQAAWHLLASAASPLPLRSMGVRGSDLTSTNGNMQMTFWTPARHIKNALLEASVDRIHERFGRQAIQRSAAFHAALAEYPETLSPSYAHQIIQLRNEPIAPEAPQNH